MYRRTTRAGWSVLVAVGLLLSFVTPALAAPPANDTFPSATVIGSIPFVATVDTTEATTDAADSEWYTTICVTPRVAKNSTMAAAAHIAPAVTAVNGAVLHLISHLSAAGRRSGGVGALQLRRAADLRRRLRGQEGRDVPLRPLVEGRPIEEASARSVARQPSHLPAPTRLDHWVMSRAASSEPGSTVGGAASPCLSRHGFTFAAYISRSCSATDARNVGSVV